jgi:type IV pilus assembly protein PilV
MMPVMPCPNQSKQHGIAMIEALIALLVLALGVLGLARLQVSALTESRNTNARAMAVQLAADLSERMQSNAVIRRANPTTNPYVTGWGAPPVAVKNCLTGNCNGNELAAFDLMTWKLNLQALLPNGDAQVFRSDTDQNQFGVLLGWTDFAAKNEEVATGDAVARYTQADVVTNGIGDDDPGVVGVACQSGFTCHLVYIRP